ncbi:MAG: stalk domain-containing protein [Armatimonadota bacterium]
MVKTRACTAGALVVLLMLSSTAVAGAARELVFDVQPVTLEGRTLVPLRPIFEWLGARVTYEGGHIKAWRSEEAKVPQVELWIGSTEAKVAEARYTVDVAPQLIDGRCFVPLRFVAESFGVWVDPQGSQMLLRMPQEEREAAMAIPPHPQTLQGKIWRLIETWYDIIPRDDADEPAAEMPEDDQSSEDAADWRSTDSLEHWNLFSEERKQELIDDVGEDAPSIIEAHWGGREVKGIRILQYKVDAGGMSAWARVLVGYPDGTSEIEYFELVREPDGWKVGDFASGDEVPESQTE